MKKIFKKKLFWFLLIVIIIVAIIIVVMLGQDNSGVEYTTQKVIKTELKQTVSATGKIKSAEEINLSFETNGRIGDIKINTGDKVTPGQLLANLISGELASRVTKAQATLNENQARLQKTIAGATLEDINITQATVEKAKSDLDSAKINLEDTKSTYNQAIDNAIEDAIVEAEKAITKAEISLSTSNDILTNTDYDEYLSVLNSNELNKANLNYSIAVSSVSDAVTANSLAKSSYSEVAVNNATSITLDALDDVVQYLSSVSRVLNNTVTGTNLTQSSLDGFKTSINTERTTTDSSKALVITDKQAISDARLNYTIKVNDGQANINAYQETLNKAQAELEFKLAPTRQEDINLYRAQVRQAEADLLIANQNLSKTILKAPTDGIVTDVKNEVGERVSEIDNVITMLATGPYEIEVNIPESDIAKIQTTNKAEITLDAFTDDIIFNGTVAMINPAQTEIQDVIYYKVTISLDELQPAQIAQYMLQVKPGMTANVDILTNIKQGVLVMPQRAIKEQNGTKYVQLLINGIPEDYEVTVGLRGDDGMIEVITGLEEGQEVVTFIKDKK
ncbi:efflux RND transporter periplasmic adaptor subunit [Patescibacteria group bacterium]|nr:efflux RND transporter periplasmic adaptor subunit [Patescibacteria group bacterium]